MLSEEAINHLALDIKRFLLSDAMLLSRASDTQLQVKIREIIDRKSGNYPMDPADRDRIARMVFSSLRGVGGVEEVLAAGSIRERWVMGA